MSGVANCPTCKAPTPTWHKSATCWQCQGGESMDVAQSDQNLAAARELATLHGRYYTGLRESGIPRWLAGILLIVHAWPETVEVEAEG